MKTRKSLWWHHERKWPPRWDTGCQQLGEGHPSSAVTSCRLDQLVYFLVWPAMHLVEMTVHHQRTHSFLWWSIKKPVIRLPLDFFNTSPFAKTQFNRVSTAPSNMNFICAAIQKLSAMDLFQYLSIRPHNWWKDLAWSHQLIKYQLLMINHSKVIKQANVSSLYHCFSSTCMSIHTSNPM